MIGYNLYVIYKEVESAFKNKETRPLTQENFNKRLSEENKQKWKNTADIFNTRFRRVNPSEYMYCGFTLYKSFDINKMFNSNILELYINNDKRKKRNIIETIDKIKQDLEYINRPLHEYARENNGFSKVIVSDYIDNKIGPTIIVYCLYKKMMTLSDIEWDMLSIIRNNYKQIELNTIKLTKTISSINYKQINK